MKQTLLFSVFCVGLFSACSVYKAGQTPDDIYYSPARESESIAKDSRDQRQQQSEYLDYISSSDDRYLHMKTANRARWSSLDDYNYWNDSRYDFNAYNYSSYYNMWNPYSMWNPWRNYYGMGLNLGYSYGLGYGWNSPFGYYSMFPYNTYGSYYGGYGWNSPIYTIVGYRPSNIQHYNIGGYSSYSNLTSFRNKSYSNSNYGTRDPQTGGFTGGSNSNFNNLLKRVFSSSSSSSSNSANNSFDRPVRTYTPSVPSNTVPSSPPVTSSSAGGNSGGYGSTGSSSSTGRGGKG